MIRRYPPGRSAYRGAISSKSLWTANLSFRRDDEGLTAGVEVSALGQRDQLLDLGLRDLGLGLAGLDALVVDQFLRQVRHQRLAVGGIATQLVSFLGVAHRFLLVT